MDMTQEEIDSYRFRVGRFHFQELCDAMFYAEACLDATCIEFRHSATVWKVLWTDGEVQYNRPGFGVLVTHRRAP